MPKITDFENFTGALAGGDILPIVDISDTSMAGTGKNKDITAFDLANGLAALADRIPTIILNELATKANVNNPTFTGTITATTFAGNSTSTTKWQSARTITLNGPVTGSVSLDGSQDVTFTTTLASNAVTADKIADGAITSAKIAPSNVVGIHIGNGEITTSKLANQAVHTEKIWPSAVTEDKIASGSITPSKIGAGAVITDKIANGAVNNDKLAVNAVTITKIANGAVGPDKLANNAVIEEKISNGNVTAAKLTGAQTGAAPIYGARAWAKLNPFIGTSKTGAYKTGNYITSSGTTTVTITGHGLKANDKIRLDFTTGGATDGLYTVVSSTNANTFTVSGAGGTGGNVTAQFVAIQGSGNVSSASWYDAGNFRIVLNFATPLPHANYCIAGAAHLYPSEWWSYMAEDTLGTTQLNTVQNCHIGFTEAVRFLNVVVFG